MPAEVLDKLGRVNSLAASQGSLATLKMSHNFYP